MNVEEYEIMYRIEHRHWWYNGLRGMIRAAFRRHGSAGETSVLDMGCGTGANMAMLNGTAEVAGLDFSTEAIAKCREEGLEVTARAAVQAVPFREGVFDTVLMMDVLCHKGVPEKKRPLEEAHRVLREDGLLLLNVPAFQWLSSSHDAAVHTDKRFTKGEVLELLRETSFEPVAVTHWNTLLFPVIALIRLWHRGEEDRGSDLAEGPGSLLEGLSTRLCASALALERALMRIAPLPFGLSIFVVARRR